MSQAIGCLMLLALLQVIVTHNKHSHFDKDFEEAPKVVQDHDWCGSAEQCFDIARINWGGVRKMVGYFNVKLVNSTMVGTFEGDLNLCKVPSADNMNFLTKREYMECFVTVGNVSLGSIYTKPINASVYFGEPQSVSFAFPPQWAPIFDPNHSREGVHGLFAYSGGIPKKTSVAYTVRLVSKPLVNTGYHNHCVAHGRFTWLVGWNWYDDEEHQAEEGVGSEGSNPLTHSPYPLHEEDNCPNNHPGWVPIKFGYNFPASDFFPPNFLESQDFKFPSHWRVPKTWQFQTGWQFTGNKTLGEILNSDPLPGRFDCQDKDRQCPAVISLYNACERNLDIRNHYCSASCCSKHNCRLQQPCVDYFPFCKENLKAGECLNKFVGYVCQKTCLACSLNPCSYCWSEL